MNSYILQLWNCVFKLLKCFSPYFIACKILPKKLTGTWGFSDTWVLLNSAIVVAVLVFLPLDEIYWLTILAASWGALRVLEIFGYLFHVVFVDAGESKDPRLLSHKRSLILALHNYAEITLWFAVAYGLAASAFTDPHEILHNPLGCVYYSVVTITTLGYGEVTPATPLTWFLTVAETLLGLFMVLVVLGWLVGLLPKRGAHSD